MANPRCRPSYTIALFWAALFMLAVSNIAHASTCIGINGEPVDFFVMYKLPGNCVSNPWQRGNVSLYMDNSTLHSGAASYRQHHIVYNTLYVFPQIPRGFRPASTLKTRSTRCFHNSPPTTLPTSCTTTNHHGLMA